MDFIDRESKRMLTSRSTIMRQLVSKAVKDEIENRPPPWMDEGQQEVQS